ncbi:dynamin family protein [Gorillibacterium sp. sgz5001074]|uniref:dynamin family protein n=1 Tax=Gorillibacterium sp. sgz5001074 TaxID=3446695 RepID=UPI003F67913D
MGARETAPALAEALTGIGGEIQARKLAELQEKQTGAELYVAFCGHFSAGKSTLVNRLCGHRLLPSGPVPTSANIVRIRNGPSAAHIYRRTETGGLSVEQIPLEGLEAACKNGEAIETVEIRYPVPLLGDTTVLLDTPGIDSTDDAHQAATQSAMHLADVVFYVMDYNYVQSEINFTFAKKLQEAGKPLYLIVNQIDKHRERELSFDSYREGVREAFRNWHIEPAGILFLSLKDPDHPHNDWSRLPALIQALSERSALLKAWNSKMTVRHLIREALASWKSGRELEKELYLEAGGGAEAMEAAVLEMKELEAREAELAAGSEKLEARWKKELQSLIDNANLTPAGTRDLAAAYLETRKPGFKVGFLARAAKTEEERSRRLEAFRTDLEEKLRAHLLWHAADYLKQEADAAGIREPEFLQELEETLKLPVTSDWLSGQVHAGPDFTGEYVLNYCRQLSSELKQLCRKALWTLLESLGSRLAAQGLEERRQLATRKREAAVQLAAYDGIRRMEDEEKAKEIALMRLADEATEGGAGGLALPDPEDLVPAAVTAGAHRTEGAGRPPGGAPEPLKRTSGAAARFLPGEHVREAAPAEESHSLGLPFDRVKRTAEKLKAGASALEELPGTGTLVRSLREKAAKLGQNRYTLALFGAFSAGKSSFANALMGERVLPVSPNPTTAAINTILPPDEQHPHGTVRVFLKSEADIHEEIVYSLRAIGMDVPESELQDSNALLSRVRKLTPDGVPPAGKPHVTFLKAVEKGWGTMAASLGQVLQASRELFHSYVADETKSCFATLVELYQDTPLSAHGVVLVDTPGADSINARHTGVAFNYIKNADAILFVTYYNHAFSQADREFLMQLGRVKDAMQLDKMFFIVNAADLASGHEELEAVLRHVEDNLLKFGIRNPRLYPVSSQMAVEAKLDGDGALLQQSGIAAFEAAFRRFAEQELTGLAVRNAERELAHASGVLEQWIRAAREDAGERERKRDALRAAGLQALERAGIPWESPDAQALQKELEEQLYYVKQRAGFRYPEMFRAAFNPAALREDAGDMKRAFKAAWQDLIRMMGYHLSQETLAVTLRMESYLNRALGTKWTRTGENLSLLLEGYEAASFEPPAHPTPSVLEAPQAEEPDVKWLLGFYRNGRHFFEGEGSAALMTALQNRLTPAVEQYIRTHADQFLGLYQLQAEQSARTLSEGLEGSVREHCAGLESVWSEGADAGRLEAGKQLLDELLHNN